MLVLHALFDRFRQISSNVETLCQFHVREASIVNAEQPRSVQDPPSGRTNGR